jgi:ribosomal protein L34E
MNILDDIIGSYNWKREHSRENANCIVSIWDENKSQWISKEDTGTESYTEKEKGLASDSFKRACFNWGIGRELYTAPFIWIAADSVNMIDKNGKKSTYDTFTLSKISYTDKIISALEIVNQKNIVVYSMGNISQPTAAAPEPKEPTPPPIICADCKKEIIDLKKPNGNITQAAKIKEYSEKEYGRCLCWTCQKKQAERNKINVNITADESA